MIVAAQVAEVSSPSISQYAPPPTNQMHIRDLNEFPPDPPDESRVKIYTKQTEPFDCQNNSVDLLPDGEEFTLVGHWSQFTGQNSKCRGVSGLWP